MEITLQIQNLKCGGCAHTIINTLSKIKAVNSVKVEEEFSSVILNLNDEKALPVIERKLKTLGYPVIDSKNTLVSKMKSYISCASGKITK